MSYTKADVKAYLHPRAPVADELIERMSVFVAAWIRTFDPEFASNSDTYEAYDQNLASDWMEMVSSAVDDGNPGAKTLLDRLEADLMRGAE